MAQQRLPFPEGEDVGRSGQLSFQFSGGQAPAPAPKPDLPSQSKAEWSARDSSPVHEGQFQMFMTPREIRSKYQALDADRTDAYDEREGDLTKRSETTGGNANIMIRSRERAELARWHGGASQIASYGYRRSSDDNVETDDQLYERKLEESQLDPGEYREVHGGEVKEPPGWNTLAQRSSAPSGVRDQAEGRYDPRTGEGTSTFQERDDEANDYMERKVEQHYENADYGPSLYDRIREEGVTHPVHLSYAQMGDLGKQQVVGGHHRVAAQHDINPDQPIPVSHHASIWEAKSSGNYR